jgi:predicted Rossmann-fold nucleotide-binding protein
MNVIIAGGRNFIANQNHEEWLKNLLVTLKPDYIFSGGAIGADAFGERIAKELSIPVKKFVPEWDKFGKVAALLRNEEMAKNAHACVIFPGGRGTSDMKKKAISYGVKVFEYEKI